MTVARDFVGRFLRGLSFPLAANLAYWLVYKKQDGLKGECDPRYPEQRSTRAFFAGHA